MDETERVFEELPKQRIFADAVFSGDYRILAYGGGIRSGKTYIMLALIFALCRIYPRSRWAIVRKDLPTLRRNTIPSFNKLRPRSFVEDINGTTWTAQCANGSEIIFFAESLDVDPDLDRWKGLEVNGFVLEEANELNVKSFNKAIERAGSWIIPGKVSQPDPLVLLTFNPSPNWVKRKFYDPWKAGTLTAPYYYLPAIAADNPTNQEAYIASLKSLPENEYRRFVEGDWDSMTGVALPELHPVTHFTPKGFVAQPHWPKFMAFDWGKVHPFSVGLYTSDTEGTTYKMETLSARGMTDPEIFDYVAGALAARDLKFSDFRYTVAGGDCWNKQQLKSGIVGPSTAETFTQNGWPMIQAADGPGSRVAGLSNLHRYLGGEPKFKFFDTPGNRACFEQMQGMLLDPDKPEDALKVDADENGDGGDDSYDETRYALMSRPLAAIAPKKPAEEQDRSPGIDWQNLRPAKRETAQDLVDRELRRDGLMNWRQSRRPRSGSW